MKRIIPLLIGLIAITMLIATNPVSYSQEPTPTPQERPPRPVESDPGAFAFWEAGQPQPEPQGEVSTSDLVDWSRIVFESFREGNWEIYIANGDGSNPVRLTQGKQADIQPRLNRGCTRIAFASARGGQYDIWAMNPDGSGLAQLTTHGASDTNPFWSPDGRRIAFQSNRDGQWEVYVMNADGSAQTRLTQDGDYDGMPAWSPDGRQIAFVSRRTGGYGIWMMNADGSGQRQLTNQAYGENPVWSPDGAQIAYDADGDGNGWQELWLMDADGSNQRQVYNPGPTRDLWARSWSPDGQYVAFTRAVWYLYKGNWYLIETWMRYWGSLGDAGFLDATNRDSSPDWQTLDTQAPGSVVAGLPAYAHSGLIVRWSGSDKGGAGLRSYDVQVRKLPDSSWTDWKTDTRETRAAFAGAAGHTYQFRARARDQAHNLEAWPPGEGDASTTLYAWAIRGALRDNRQTPITGERVGLIPEAFLAIPSGVDGAYAAYEAPVSDVYTATWGKAGYGVLPPTAFDGNRDARIDIVLPPADNVVLNGGFESGSLAPEWLAGGDILPGVTSDTLHTGRFSAAIGQAEALFTPSVKLPDSTGNLQPPVAEVDGSGAVHVLWWKQSGDYGDVMYARRERGGSWSTPISISGSQQPSGDSWSLLQLAVQADGTAHVAWAQRPEGGYGQIYYGQRSRDGTWSDPVTVSRSTGQANDPVMALGIDGTVHLVWRDASHGGQYIMYARRSPGGAWSPLAAISQEGVLSGLEAPQVAAGPDGAVHAVWVYQGQEIWYARRGSDGAWSAPLNLSTARGELVDPALAVAGDGSVHVAWNEGGDGGRIQYAYRSAGGTWSDPVQVSDLASRGSRPQLVLGPDGSVHVAFTGRAGGVVYVRRGADGVWSSQEVVGSGGGGDLRVDSTGTAHITCARYIDEFNSDVFYARRTAGGYWSNWTNVSNGEGYSEFPHLALDGKGSVHVVWEEYRGEQSYILYAESARAAATGQSILSQGLTVPAKDLAPTLSFWYLLQSVPTPGAAWFSAQVDNGLTNTAVFTATRGGDWAHGWVDLSPWAGQAVSLRFLVHQTKGQPAAGAALDEVTLGSAHPDLWVGKESRPQAAMPGEQVVHILTYGNRGGAAARGVRVTDALPATLSYVAARPAPTTTGATLAWEVGDLAAQSGPFTIVVTTTLSSGAVRGRSYANAASISAASAELETENNTVQSTIWVGGRGYLPVVHRQ